MGIFESDFLEATNHSGIKSKIISQLDKNETIDEIILNKNLDEIVKRL
ncbi:hypothetical protein RV06_GL001529 [Enterococcus haemoperoxidus]|nr:hypothetical protein RV06_GL001529 [Enterococcus haemoperoxidus]